MSGDAGALCRPYAMISAYNAAMHLRLYDFSASPFCIKVRSILDHKKLGYERIDASNPSVMLSLKRKGGIGKVPALEIGNRLVCDSTNIAYAIEELAPEPPLVPSDPIMRAHCHLLEDWADESLYWLGVYFRWWDPAGRAGAPAIFPKGFMGKSVVPRIVERVARKQLIGQGTGRKPPETVAADLDRSLDHLKLLLGANPFLLGDRPWLCDFAVNGQLVYLSRTPHGRLSIDARPELGAYLERMKALRSAG